MGTFLSCSRSAQMRLSVWIGGSGKIKDLNALKIAVESGKLVQQQPNVIW